MKTIMKSEAGRTNRNGQGYLSMQSPTPLRRKAPRGSYFFYQHKIVSLFFVNNGLAFCRGLVESVFGAQGAVHGFIQIAD